MNILFRQIQFIHGDAVAAADLLPVSDTDIEIALICVCKPEGFLPFLLQQFLQFCRNLFLREYGKLQISELYIPALKKTAAA